MGTDSLWRGAFLAAVIALSGATGCSILFESGYGSWAGQPDPSVTAAVVVLLAASVPPPFLAVIKRGLPHAIGASSVVFAQALYLSGLGLGWTIGFDGPTRIMSALFLVPLVSSFGALLILRSLSRQDAHATSPSGIVTGASLMALAAVLLWFTPTVLTSAEPRANPIYLTSGVPVGISLSLLALAVISALPLARPEARLGALSASVGYAGLLFAATLPLFATWSDPFWLTFYLLVGIVGAVQSIRGNHVGREDRETRRTARSSSRSVPARRDAAPF